MSRHVPHAPFVRLFLLVLCLLGLTACASKEQLYYAAPGMLPATDRLMRSPGYWIARHPSPDSLILDEMGIENLNRAIGSDGELITDVTTLSDPCPAAEIREDLQELLASFRERELFRAEGSRVTPAFYDDMEVRMNLETLPAAIPLRYGLVVHYADQRVFPTGEALYGKPFDLDFDELQNSALDVGTPVAVVHTSLDGKWYYVIDQLNAGWIAVENVALCAYEDVLRYVSAGRFAVVVAPKADLYLDSGLTDYYDCVRMGLRFPLRGRGDDGAAEIVLPLRKDDGRLAETVGYIRAGSVHEGYLPYTPRTIYYQAFGLLNAPYGWGGMYGEQDCSRFVQEVFATVGITLPRNSSKQAQVGVMLGEYPEGGASEEKIALLARHATGACTLLYLRGHIMIYLGLVKGRPYAIHNPWAYRQHLWWGDRVRLINRVAVTDLSLGEGSRRGSFLERLCSVRFISWTGAE